MPAVPVKLALLSGCLSRAGCLATRRFNQAWLMDPANPEVYTGFAAVLHDRDRFCDAMQMMEKALSLKPPSFQGVYADAGRIAARCAAQDPHLTGPERAAMIARTDALFRNGERVEPDKAYLYSAWATAYYWNRQYADAWAVVSKARQAGGRDNARFPGDAAREDAGAGAALRPARRSGRAPTRGRRWCAVP